MSETPRNIIDDKKILDAVALATRILSEAWQTDNEQEVAGHTENSPVTSGKSTNNKSSSPKKESVLWRVILGVCVLVFSFCAVRVVLYAFTHNRTEKTEKQLRTYVEYDTASSGGTGRQAADISHEEMPQIKVDFEKLKSINEDIIGWIFIPGTDVNYPILAGEDNSYYLSHDASGRYSPDGAIFVDMENSTAMTDFDTVIYGHNMSTGTMFKTLHNYEDSDFLDNYRGVYVYLPGRTLCYKVFAAYRTNDRRVLATFDFDRKEDREKYLSSIFNENFETGIVKNDQRVDVEDKILTLSTCCGINGKRWIVQAVLWEENNN